MDQLERRFKPAMKIYSSKACFGNFKESIDLFLYEADKEQDFENV